MYKATCHKFNRWFNGLPEPRRLFTFLGIAIMPVEMMTLSFKYGYNNIGSIGLIIVLFLILVRMEK